ncbi:hypothetical protein KY358_00055 [Candidatus Woesearchaeota archaeon]|nr:hypothetical protein [Candidatus Woesearchaeota archaeon]
MRKEKKSRWGAIVVFFISFIMATSIIGFLYGGESDTVKYDEFRFRRTDIGWSARIGDKILDFSFFPSEVENINLSQDIVVSLLNRPEIDTTSELDSLFSEEIALAQYNMAVALNNIRVYVRKGAVEEDNEFGLPSITCEDATSSVPVIYFMRSNQTKVSLEDNCIIAEARSSVDILRIGDRLLYSMLGIIR